MADQPAQRLVYTTATPNTSGGTLELYIGDATLRGTASLFKVANISMTLTQVQALATALGSTAFTNPTAGTVTNADFPAPIVAPQGYFNQQ